MAKRTSVRRFDTEAVQGDGSFVTLSSLKVKEIRVLRKTSRAAEKAADDSFDAFEEGVKLLAKHIVAWNWVDDDGEPLPVPKGSASAIDGLTNEEVDFLSDLLTEGDAKNSESKSPKPST